MSKKIYKEPLKPSGVRCFKRSARPIQNFPTTKNKTTSSYNVETGSSIRGEIHISISNKQNLRPKNCKVSGKDLKNK